MSIDTALQMFYASIGRLLVVGGGGAVIACGVFQWLGKTWLDQHFRKQLELFKHAQQRELEQLRHEINAIFSRISKIHEKEFEVLPKAWQLLHEAHGAVSQVVKAFRQWPDLNRMPDPQLDEFLAASRLAEFQKADIRKEGNKLKYYQEAIFWYELRDAKNAQIALNNYLAVNSIFMTEVLRQEFKAINKALSGVIVDEEIFHTYPDTDLSINERAQRIAVAKSKSANMDQISETFNSIEAAVQKRLRYEDA